MISIDVKSEHTEQFKLPNGSLLGSPDKDAIMGVSKTLKETSMPAPQTSAFTSKANSMYGSDSNMDTVGSEEDAEFDGLLYKDPSNSTSTLQMLNVLRKNRQLCDLILQLDDDSQDIYCHQLILACNSKFFMEIFNNEQDEIGERSTEESGNKKQSLSDFINKNHGDNKRQILFCLSAYLRNFLSGSHHHYAKINSIINHNNHTYQKKHLHSSAHNIDMTHAGVHDDETINRINQNLDCQALKICIDYMYTSKLKVGLFWKILLEK